MWWAPQSEHAPPGNVVFMWLTCYLNNGLCSPQRYCMAAVHVAVVCDPV